MSLVAPYSNIAKANVVEDKYIRAWSKIEVEVERLLNLGWKMDTKGNAKAALKSYKAANYYIYLFHYAMNIDSYITRNKIDRTCISKKVFTEFKIDCVQKNLPCISNDLGGNYLSAWESIALELKIEIKKPCDDITKFKGTFSYCSFSGPNFSLPSGIVTASCVPVDPKCSVLKQITP